MLKPMELKDWEATPEKLEECVRRIVAASDPLQIILFGSRARGEQLPDSDVDLAVILDGTEQQAQTRLRYSVLRGVRMAVDMVVVTKEKFDLHRPWVNSIFNYIDREGIVLYDREHPESAGKDAMRVGWGRRVDAAVSAA